MSGSGARPSRDDGWRQTPPPAELELSAAPTIASAEVEACPVCAAGEHHQLAVGFDYEIQTCRNPWRFVRCDRCTHVWLNPRPAVEELATIYPPSYYAYNYESVSPIARRGKNVLDRLKMRTILRRLGRRPGSYADIGCGDGRYLRELERRGVPRERLYGLELDAAVVERLAGQGYRVYCERAEDAESIPEASLDLVTMFHVIEHVDDPAAVVRRMAGWLAPGGVLALETPNLDSLDARLFQRCFWGGYHFPRHWNLFTPDTLGRLLSAAGLRVETVAYQTGHSFWMYSFHHLLRYRESRPMPRLARWFDPLASLPFLVLFTAFDKLRAALGARTSAMLVLATKPG